MDPLPQLLLNTEANDTEPVIRCSFQDDLQKEIFSPDLADNVAKYKVDDDLSLKTTAQNVQELFQHFVSSTENIKRVEEKIKEDHRNHHINKNHISKDDFFKELSKLKPCDIFDINFDDVEKYGLIQKSDLYPDKIRQFLDFRFNPSRHECKECFPIFKNKTDNLKSRFDQNIKMKKKTKNSGKGEEKYFKIEPESITFFDFETNAIYEKHIKIINTSSQLQNISVKALPKLPIFTIIFESRKLAPGMSINATIRFCPELYLNLRDEVSFKNSRGQIVSLPIHCHRDPPKLLGYIYKVNDYSDYSVERHIPGSKAFSTKRRAALNDTIDCGSCLATDYVFIKLLLLNKGSSAKFFWISEEDFYNENIKSVSKNLEFRSEGFWIFPAYFEAPKGETCEINILFHPLKCGLHIQALLLMCDNNNYKQIEIVGDAVCFDKSLISVHIPDITKNLEKMKGHCIFLGYIKSDETDKFTLSIENTSSLFLKYEFAFETDDENFDMSGWIKISNNPSLLAPYSVTDIIFEVHPQNVSRRGYYNMILRFLIKNIPIASLEEEDAFLIKKSEKTLQEIVETASEVDIILMEANVACHVEPVLSVTEKDSSPEDALKCDRCIKTEKCPCENCSENLPQADLVFSESLLDIGILPPGVDVKKDFHLSNIGNNTRTWRIVEIKYNISSSPHVEILEKTNLSLDEGTLLPGESLRISYNIPSKPPNRWVSILVVFSVTLNDTNNDSESTANSICLVTYEITELNIVVKTGRSEEPILCPLQMLYTDVPIRLSFKLQNYSLIGGCFYFLKPIGTDADKIRVEYNPEYGELKPHSSKKIRVNLTCNDVGILENIFLPCFIGLGQDPLLIRLLCVVDCIHVFFYIPNVDNEYNKVLWPPKVVYEYDRSWSQYCMCEELSIEHENTIQDIQSQNTIQIMEKSSKSLSEIKTSISSIKENNMEAELDQGGNSILETLVNVDSEVILQECVMQVKNVFVKKPKKVTIYIENITPKRGKYTIQSTNWPAKENCIQQALTIKYKTIEELWEPMIDKNGILVQPKYESGILNPHELVPIDIWIYANTWGLYTEEIVVDFVDITCFTFSIIIEVVGCPLQLPLSIGAITEYPTLRFGSVAFGSDDIIRSIIVTNTSSIRVNVFWHIFYFCEDEDGDRECLPPFNFIYDIIENNEGKLQFDFTERFFGVENSNCLEVQPSQQSLQSNSKASLLVVFKPSSVDCDTQKCSLKCYILGRIFTDEADKFKSSYFYRKNSSIVIEVTAAVEKPSLDISIDVENNTFCLYANEVVLDRKTEFVIPLTVRNSTSSIVEAEFVSNEPFSFDNLESQISLNAGKCRKNKSRMNAMREAVESIHLSGYVDASVKMQLLCNFTQEKITKWASLIHDFTETTDFLRTNKEDILNVNADEEKLPLNAERTVDNDNKILTLHRKLVVCYKGGCEEVIPLDISIYYPNIAVKPIHVKFGYVLIGRTRKTFISVYNLTGCKVLFEVFKSLSGQEITVTPPHGEIEKSTSLNHSFVNISIYFTPTECRNYQESIRIITNIPQYYIDIPIKGTGSFNEKFDGSC